MGGRGNLKAVSGVRWSKKEVKVKALVKMAKVGLNSLEGDCKDVCQRMYLSVRPQNFFPSLPCFSEIKWRESLEFPGCVGADVCAHKVCGCVCLCLSVCTCVHVCVCPYTGVCTCGCICASTCICVHACVCVHICVNTGVCMWLPMCVCACVCVHRFVCKYVYVCPCVRMCA